MYSRRTIAVLRVIDLLSNMAAGIVPLATRGVAGRTPSCGIYGQACAFASRSSCAGEDHDGFVQDLCQGDRRERDSSERLWRAGCRAYGTPLKTVAHGE